MTALEKILLRWRDLEDATARCENALLRYYTRKRKK
jgi:hypothetical protein